GNNTLSLHQKLHFLGTVVVVANRLYQAEEVLKEKLAQNPALAAVLVASVCVLTHVLRNVSARIAPVRESNKEGDEVSRIMAPP
ncbi:MAG TPA: hypothetical protein VL177_05695, partial [Terriglobales bacterium]|nr:hypothetical protein [Terriglobales bacterium]